MGNCCCDRREDNTLPTSESKDNSSLRPQHSTLPCIPPKETHTGSIVSTTGSDTNEMRHSEPMRGFKDLLVALERQDKLSDEQQIHTKLWIGTVDVTCAQTALKVTMILQGEEFETSPLIRLGYYTLFKHCNTFSTLLKGLQAGKPCVRYTFARLLEVILSVYHNLTFNITHDLMALDVFPRLEQALRSSEPPEYWVCLSNILHCMYSRNVYIQRLLARPSSYPLVSQLVKLLEQLTAPLLLRTHAENMRDFAMRFDGEVLEENWKCLQVCGLFEAIAKARETLRASKGNVGEIAHADRVLRQLLAF